MLAHYRSVRSVWAEQNINDCVVWETDSMVYFTFTQNENKSEEKKKKSEEAIESFKQIESFEQITFQSLLLSFQTVNKIWFRIYVSMYIV